MKTLSEQELAETETLLRQRLAQLADHAPTTVQVPGEVQVVALDGRRRSRRFGVIAAVTALVGAGSFTTYSLLGASNDGGAATPEEAVTTFASALAHQDLLGMIDVTLPEEVAVLRDAVASTTADATRLDLLSDNFDAASVNGVDVSVNDLTLSTDYLEGGLASVTATGGSISASFDPQAFPFGSKLRTLLGLGQQIDTRSAGLGTTNPPVLLMTVERGGRWYVSVEYTLAEYMRRSAQWEPSGPVTRSPVGFDSPEAAVTAFYDRLAALDLRGALDMFAPGEDAMAWLAQSWLPSAEAAIERGRADGWAVAVSALSYESIGSGDHRTLLPLTFKVEGTTPAGFNRTGDNYSDPSRETLVWAFDGSGYTIAPPGQVPATAAELTFTPGVPALGPSYNFTSTNPDGTIVPLQFAPEPTGGPQPFSVERADGCTTYLGAGVDSMLGLSTSSLFEKVDGGYRLCGTGASLGAGLVLLFGGVSELPAVSVVETGGKWYVSPLGTALASISTSLHGLDDGASLFDSPLGPFLYGGMTRGLLGSMLAGQSADSVDPACLPALNIVDGKVKDIVADPAREAIQACAMNGFSSEGGSGPIVTPEPVTVSTEAVMATVPAPTP